MSSRRVALDLYRHMLRESDKMPNYNFRMYAKRKIRDTFRENKTINDRSQIDREIEEAKKHLEMLRKQGILEHLYTSERLVIERKKTLRPDED